MRYFATNIFLGSLLSLFIANSSYGQIVTIPDPEMVNWFTAKYPSCISGDQLDTQCPDVLNETLVHVFAYPIVNLDGLQYFINADTLVLANLVGITVIDHIPDNIKNLQIASCTGNVITSFPASAEYIYIANNYDLTTLPVLPTGLNYLCLQSLTSMSSLPSLPSNLDSLYLYGMTNIVTLSPLPDNLVYLRLVMNNSITSLPYLPDSINFLEIIEMSLTCLPNLPSSLQYGPGLGVVWFYPNTITCLPNIPAGITDTYGLGVCSPYDPINNPNNCIQDGSIISGFVYEDVPNPCSYDAGADLGISGAKVMLIDEFGDTSQITYSLNSGFYSFYQVDAGDYTLTYDTTSMYYTPGCVYSPIDSLLTVAPATTYDNVNFNALCTVNFDVFPTGAFSAGWVFPGQNHTAHMLHDLIGCTGSGTVKVVIHGPADYDGPALGALTPSAVDGDTLWYNAVNFGGLDPNDFSVILYTEITATSEDSICFEISIDAVGDVNPDNNAITACYPVLNSYDPNVKYVSHAVVEPGYDDWLTYTFFFQNTGSAPAFDIVVRDTLSGLLRHNTFEFLAASHGVEVHTYNNLVTFVFENIMLPDSTSNPEGSIGFAQFRIKPQSDLIEGTEITNEVDIYFDFNAPITTDLATTLYQINTDDLSVPEKNGELKLYPNPAKNEFRILINEPIEFVQLVSMDGSVLLNSNQNMVNISSLAVGVYLIQVHTAQGIYIAKLVKE